MASKKLLQKSTKSKTQKTSNANKERLLQDAEKNLSSLSTLEVAAEAVPRALLVQPRRAFTKLATVLIEFVIMLKRRRERLFELRVRSLLQKSFAFVPKAARAAWRTGGGEESIALTLALLA